MDRNYGPRLDALVNDLETHHTNAAANLLREELQVDPRAARAMINDAKRSSSNQADQIIVERDGDVRVYNQYDRRAIMAGRLYEPQYSPGFAPPQYGERFPVPVPVPVPVYPGVPYGGEYEHRRRPELNLGGIIAPGVGLDIEIPLGGDRGRWKR